MSEWIRLCAANEAPQPGEVVEVNAGSTPLCLANIDGQLHALDNVCPHRQGPLGQGWIEGHAVVCPWHAWAFDVTSGICDEPERAQVKVFPVLVQDGGISVDLA